MCVCVCPLLTPQVFVCVCAHECVCAGADKGLCFVAVYLCMGDSFWGVFFVSPLVLCISLTELSRALKLRPPAVVQSTVRLRIQSLLILNVLHD